MISISHSSSGKTTPSILESYTYLSGRGLKASQTYANNQKLNYTYDSQDRLIGVSSAAGPISKYEYNSNGLMGKSYSYTENAQNPNYILNQYDLAERLISTYNSKGSGIYDISYDKNNLATGYKSYLRDGSANLEYTTQYAYNEFPNGDDSTGVDKPKIDSLKTGTTSLANTTFGYDYYGRNTTMLASAGTSDSHIKIGYSYLDVGTDKTTTLPATMAVRYTTTDSSPVDILYRLSYDRAGNITKVENAPLNGVTYNEGYTYDSLSRLTGATNVDNSGDNYSYTYDDRDNIIGSTVTNNGTTTQTKAYTYATDDINRLASFSHTTASGTATRNYTYDAIGNPTAISVNDSSDNSTRNLALTWTQGRLLSNVSDGSTLNNTYCYNAAGNISKKTLANGSYVIYHYNGGKLEYEEHFNSAGTLQELLKYSYDVSGDVEYLLYKDNNFSNANAFDLYYYVRDGVDNITDIFQLREQSGSSTTVVNRLAAHYEYDPYGNILSIDKYNNDPIGDINPIRYKDYYYDLQTGWYQTGSRFYDPGVGRFLNADGYASTGQGISGTNMYAYCGDNPVNRTDPSGTSWKKIKKFFKKASKKIMKFAKRTFRLTSSVSYTKEAAKTKPVSYSPITYTTGVINTQRVSSSGSSSAPFTLNYTYDTDDPILSSSLNVTLTISNFSIKFSSAPDNTGFSGSVSHGDTSSSFGVKYSLIGLKSGYEYSTESISGDSTDSTYHNASFNGFFVFVLFGEAYSPRSINPQMVPAL